MACLDSSLEVYGSGGAPRGPRPGSGTLAETRGPRTARTPQPFWRGGAGRPPIAACDIEIDQRHDQHMRPHVGDWMRFQSAPDKELPGHEREIKPDRQQKQHHTGTEPDRQAELY